MEQRPPVLAVREGQKYGYEYTVALKNQCGAFVLGDDRPLRTDFKGWFSKIEIFAPWNDDLRPCLYFDLDTYIVGDLKPLFELDFTKFWLIDDFNRPERGESGVMICPKHSDIWENRGKLRNLSTDGEFFREFPHKRLNREISGIYSYKKHAKRQMPKDSRIICFHGTPKPPETHGWAKEWWNSQTRKLSAY